MKEKVDYLPLGSIVIVNGGVKKYMIVGRGLRLKVEGEDQFFDYGACLYPEGMVGDRLMYFQHSAVKKVIFEGFSDEDNRMIVENIQEQYEKLKLEHADIRSLKGLAEG